MKRARMLPLLMVLMAALLGLTVVQFQPASASGSTIVASADTYANHGAPATNYGASCCLAAGGGAPYVAYLRFVVPSGVTGATLTLSVGSQTFAGSTSAFSVAQASDTWTESTLTWNNRPAVSATVLGSFTGGSQNGKVTLALSNASTLAGHQVTLAVTGGSDDLWFWSREHGAATAPTLSVTNEPTATTTTDTPTPTPTPTDTPTPTPTASTTGAPARHLAVIVMENKEYTQIVGSADAPYINKTLIPAGRLFTHYYATQHPSLPDYLVLTSGQHGSCVTDTCAPQSLTNDNLFARLNGAGVSWKVYAESMPSNCYLANSGAYLVRHNPPAFYTNLGPAPGGDGTCGTQDVPYSTLAADIAANTLPAFAMVIPNQYNDMHTDAKQAPCVLATALADQICQGDKWLQANLPALLSDGGRNDVTVMLLFDEGTSQQGGGGRVLLVEAGPNTCAGCTEAAALDHYGLADALEQQFGLSPIHGPVPTL